MSDSGLCELQGKLFQFHVRRVGEVVSGAKGWRSNLRMCYTVAEFGVQCKYIVLKPEKEYNIGLNIVHFTLASSYQLLSFSTYASRL